MSHPRKNKRQKAKKNARVRADRNRWSESSQRTYALIEYYEDFSYTCRGCAQDFVFTAAEQKQAFEVDHVYIHWSPKLCIDCKAQKQSAAESVRHYEARWRADKEAVEQDRSFLKRWRRSLKTHARFGGGVNSDVTAMLQRVLGEK